MSFNQEKHDELFQTARNLAVVHNLLQAGTFTGSQYPDLAVAVPFIASMHQAVMKDLEPLMQAKEEIEAPVVETAVS